MKQRKAFTREEVKLMVIQALAIERQRVGSPYDKLTLTDLAHKLNRTASTKFRDIVGELVISGDIGEKTEPYPGIAGKRRLYYLEAKNLAHLLREKQADAGQRKRHIKVNSRQQSFDLEVLQ